MSRVWDGAGVKFAKDLVAIPCDQVVYRVAEKARKKSARQGSCRPSPAQFREDYHGSIGA